MANIKSAKKRVLVNKRQKSENRLVKTSLNTEIKKFKKAVAENDLVKAEAMLANVESDIMSAKSKGVLHANAASRKVSRLKTQLNKAKGANTVVEAPVVEEKAEVKVEAKVEEAPVKKTTRKTAAKKEATEEPAKKATKTTTARKTKKAE